MEMKEEGVDKQKQKTQRERRGCDCVAARLDRDLMLGFLFVCLWVGPLSPY
jgi:hypothetical protein